MRDVLAECHSKGGRLRVANLLVTALVNLLEKVAGRLVQRSHVAPLARKTLDVHRVGEVSQVHRMPTRLTQVV